MKVNLYPRTRDWWSTDRMPKRNKLAVVVNTLSDTELRNLPADSALALLKTLRQAEDGL